MENTATQAGNPPGVNGQASAIQAHPPKPAAERQTARGPKPLALRALMRLADLRITVVLFTLALFLVFFGTLAQVDKGIWTVVSEYFRNWGIVWIPLKIITLRIVDSSFPIPYPGGWLLGGLLLVNLLAAHTVSFKLTWKRSGILLIHGGIVLMMLGELLTGKFAVEYHMRIVENQSTNYLERYDRPELAIVDASDLKRDRVTVIPTAILREGSVVRNDSLPFDVEVVQYMVNSNIVKAKPGDENLATRGVGLSIKAVSRPEGVGVDSDQRIDLASAYVTLKRKGTGEPLGTYLFSTFPMPALLDPEHIEVDGNRYQVSLRFQRTYKDYSFRLDKLTVVYFKGTSIPKDYSSYIHLTDKRDDQNAGDGKEKGHDVRIWMNHPLSYAGETFYQSGADEEGRATTLQVVSNPGWILPYLSCFVVAGGMLVHFGQNLYRFVERRVA